MKRTRGALALLSAVLLAGCGMDASLEASNDEGRAQEPGGGADAGVFCCASNADCPTSYTCESCQCRPPEVEKERASAHRPPAASPRYVYALNPGADSVARIDPATLSIEALAVGSQPVDLVALTDEDVAVALSFGDGSLSIIDSSTVPSRVVRVALGRQFGRLAVSADGAFAVAFPDPSTPPPAGAEGVVAVVDLDAAREGAPPDKIFFERAVGYRVTDVVFRLEQGVATRALVVTRDSIADLDLTGTRPSPLAPRVALPPFMSADVKSRELVATADGAHLVLRSTVEPQLAWFDGTSLRTVTLPEVATDLDLLADGSAAVVALRASGTLGFIEIPGDLLDPGGIELLPVGGGLVGQVVLPRVTGPAGFALVYTNSVATRSFARVELPSGAVTTHPVRKLVDEIALAPDGKSAVIVHRAEPASVVEDLYERAIDRAEGYSLFDLASGYVQLKTTGAVEPGPFAFSPAGGHLAVALRDDAAGRHVLDTVNLSSLVTRSLGLLSAPLHLGPVPAAQGSSPHRVFISQSHAAGRISVVSLDDGQVRTATGFTLNAEIE